MQLLATIMKNILPMESYKNHAHKKIRNSNWFIFPNCPAADPLLDQLYMKLGSGSIKDVYSFWQTDFASYSQPQSIIESLC